MIKMIDKNTWVFNNEARISDDENAKIIMNRSIILYYSVEFCNDMNKVYIKIVISKKISFVMNIDYDYYFNIE